jgi:hypothetical protein
MNNRYLIEWNHGYGESGTYTALSTAELLDIFDLRVQREIPHFYYQSFHSLEDYEVSPLIGSINPLTDVYEIARIANSREPGVVVEGPLVDLTPTLWFADFQFSRSKVHCFGSEPATAVSGLLTMWAEIVSTDGSVDPSEIHDYRGNITVTPIKPGTAYGMASEASRHLYGQPTVLRGNDPIFDDVFSSFAPNKLAPGL